MQGGNFLGAGFFCFTDKGHGTSVFYKFRLDFYSFRMRYALW